MKYTRSAATAMNSFDPVSRTFTGVLTTFAPVQRRGYIETLDPNTFDLASCQGAPIQIEHDNSVMQTVGRVLGAWFDGNSVAFRGEIIDSPQTKHVQELLKNNLIKGVSIGYSGHLSPAPASKQNAVRKMTGIKVIEVSLTQSPADSGCVIRKENPMQNADTHDENDSSIQKMEYRREVRTIAKKAGLSSEWADAQIDSEADLQAVKAAAFDHAEKRSVVTQTRTAPITVINAGISPQETRTAVEEALYSRMSGKMPGSEQARHYRSMSMREIAAQRLEETGISTRGMSTDELFKRSVIGGVHGVSDFPALLANSGNRLLLDSYQAASSPVVSVLSRQTTAPDFRPNSRLRLSGIGSLAEVPEGGEITNSTRSESVESYALKTYAKIFDLSRQALVNDDLGAFADFSRAGGVAAANTEADLLTSKLLSNPKMADGKQAFSAAHGNSGTSVLNVTGLSDARKALRQMRGDDGLLINVQPKYLLVGSDLETTAEQLLAQIYAATPDASNPFSGTLTLLVEPRLTGNQWFLFADPAVVPVLERAYLSSAAGVQITQEDAFSVLATRFRVHLDVGAGLIDYRGAVMNVAA